MGRWIRRGLGIGLLVAAAIVVGVMLFRSPSHVGDWKTEYARLPTVVVDGDQVKIDDLRDFRYNADGTIRKANWRNDRFDLSTVDSLWYGISHFADYGLAHTFLSFGFSDGRYLVISIEARQENGQSYHPVRGLFRSYELAYILADERDVIGVRTHFRKERLLLHRIIIDNSDIRRLLEALLIDAANVKAEAAFYNTLTDNCTTSILKYVKQISLLQRLFDYRVVLPGFSDKIAHGLGLLGDEPLEDIRARATIDPTGIDVEAADFSQAIRR